MCKHDAFSVQSQKNKGIQGGVDGDEYDPSFKAKQTGNWRPELENYNWEVKIATSRSKAEGNKDLPTQTQPLQQVNVLC